LNVALVTPDVEPLGQVGISLNATSGAVIYHLGLLIGIDKEFCQDSYHPDSLKMT
jgi:hypothetical protein